jgi:anti-anti-sigma factor
MLLVPCEAALISQSPIEKLMAIRKLTAADSCELVVPGRIDGPMANQLEIDILAAMREGFSSIYVNLAEASFLCSAGIRVLLQYHRQMKNNKRTLLVTRPSPDVDSILELTGFRDLIVEGARPQGAV